jgi:hypothetical protein
MHSSVGLTMKDDRANSRTLGRFFPAVSGAG